MKTPKILLTLVIIIAAAILVRGVRVEQYRDAYVRAGEVKHLWDMFAIHASRPLWLTVGGNTHLGVRGQPPYYLEVPGLKAILFVTDHVGKVVFHVVHTTGEWEVEIDGKGSTFGWSIGTKRTKGDEFTEWIEAATNSQIWLVTRTDWGKARTQLDLFKKTVTQFEDLYLDANGQVTNRAVYLKGK